MVLGASMAGLLAARVLTDCYEQVTVIDRDELTETPTHRRGVPHGRHIHALAARGQQVLEELFPGLTAELVAHGAPAGDMLTDARFYLSGHRLHPARTGLTLLCASRPFLEATCAGPGAGHPERAVPGPLRRRRTGHDPGWSSSHRRAGAAPGRRQRRGAVGCRPGRRRQRPGFTHLVLAGVPRPPRPEREEVQIGLGYATRIYRLRPDILDETIAILDAATAQLPRTGALQRLEGDRWMLTLAGILGDHPPTDPDGFLDFARSLRFPDIYEAIRNAEPLDDPVASASPPASDYHYERLTASQPASLPSVTRCAASTRSTARA